MELVKMIRNNVIRNVPVDKVAFREAEGFKKVSDEAQAPSNPVQNANDNGEATEGDKTSPTGENGDENTTPNGTDTSGDPSTPDTGDAEGDKTSSEGENADVTPEGGADGKLTEEELQAKTVKELRDVAKSLNIGGYANMQKETLIGIILASQE